MVKKILLFLLCFLFTIEAHSYHYALSVGAIFRNEAPYLKEWIEFHKLVGVQHFYLFNNCSTDDYQSVIQSYIDNGEVELIQWPWEAHSWNHWIYEVQPNAYEHCLLLAKGETKWLAIIDIDEFLTPIKSTNVLDVLNDYETFGGVGFNWKIFGNSDLWELPNGKLMIESLVMTAPRDRPTHLGVKSIVRPERVKACKHPHYVIYEDGFYHVNSQKEANIDSDGVTNGVYYDKLVINHYWSRSGSYLYQKLNRYRAWFPDISPENWQEYVKGMNEFKDTSMERFAAPLRMQMGLLN